MDPHWFHYIYHDLCNMRDLYNIVNPTHILVDPRENISLLTFLMYPSTEAAHFFITSLIYCTKNRLTLSIIV